MTDNWTPCSERLPEDGAPVLVYTPRAITPQTVHVATFSRDKRPGKNGHGWIGYRDTYWIGDSVTHWMPLPSPPAEK